MKCNNEGKDVEDKLVCKKRKKKKKKKKHKKKKAKKKKKKKLTTQKKQTTAHCGENFTLEKTGRSFILFFFAFF